MRGRTNIVQRVGPTVIGNLVTQKQVTGSAISVGDFVEFTGSTSEYDVITSSAKFQLSSTFSINDNKWGYVLYNRFNQMINVYLLSGSNLLKTFSMQIDVVLYLPTDDGYNHYKTEFVINSFYESNKLYVTFGAIEGGYVYNSSSKKYAQNLKDKNFIAVFDIYNNSVSFEKYISLGLNYDSYSSDVREQGSDVIAPIVKNGKIFLFVPTDVSNPTTSQKGHPRHKLYLYIFDVNGTFIGENVATFNFHTIDRAYLQHKTSYIVDDGLCFDVAGDYIFIIDYMSVYVADCIKNTLSQVPSSKGEDGYGIKGQSTSCISKIDDLYVLYETMNYDSKGSWSDYIYTVPYGGLFIFSFVNGMVTLLFSNTHNFSSYNQYHLGEDAVYYYRYKRHLAPKRLLCYKIENNKYCIITIYAEQKISYSDKSYFVFDSFVYDNENMVLEEIGYSSFIPVDDVSIYNFDIKKYGSDYFVVFFGGDNGSDYTNSNTDRTYTLVATKHFILDNNVAEFIQGYDLVKPYKNRIDGVAKSGGAIGDLISVYTP